MNFIKITLVMLTFFSTVTVSAHAQAVLKFGNLTFGDGETGRLFRVGTSLPPEERTKIKPDVDLHIAICFKNNIHPFHWFENAPKGVSFTFPVSGNLKDIYAELAKVDITDTSKGRPCWIWNGITHLSSITINLNPKGEGWMELFEGEKVVGWITCQSCERSKQPKEGTCSIIKKWTDKDKEAMPGEVGKRSDTADSWMPWAMELDNPTGGIFLHGGSLITQSLGCVRGPRLAMELVYYLTREGMKVNVVYWD